MRDNSKMDKELKTVQHMICIFCRGHHHGADGLCQECEALLDYVAGRLEKCPFCEDHGHKTPIRQLTGLMPSAARDCSTYKFRYTSFLKFESHNKPKCAQCPVHCYKPEMNEKIRAVMKYSGPRMIYLHPILCGRHFLK